MRGGSEEPLDPRLSLRCLTKSPVSSEMTISLPCFSTKSSAVPRMNASGGSSCWPDGMVRTQRSMPTRPARRDLHARDVRWLSPPRSSSCSSVLTESSTWVPMSAASFTTSSAFANMFAAPVVRMSSFAAAFILPIWSRTSRCCWLSTSPLTYPGMCNWRAPARASRVRARNAGLFRLRSAGDATPDKPASVADCWSRGRWLKTDFIVDRIFGGAACS